MVNILNNSTDDCRVESPVLEEKMTENFKDKTTAEIIEVKRSQLESLGISDEYKVTMDTYCSKVTALINENTPEVMNHPKVKESVVENFDHLVGGVGNLQNTATTKSTLASYRAANDDEYKIRA